MSHSRQKIQPLPMCSLHDVFGGHDHVNGNYLPHPPHVIEVEQNNSQKGKKNHVALYVQPNVRLLLWTDPDLHTKYNRFLPPALPMCSSSKESLTSVGSAAPSPSQPLDDLSSRHLRYPRPHPHHRHLLLLCIRLQHPLMRRSI